MWDAGEAEAWNQTVWTLGNNEVIDTCGRCHSTWDQKAIVVGEVGEMKRHGNKWQTNCHRVSLAVFFWWLAPRAAHTHEVHTCTDKHPHTHNMESQLMCNRCDRCAAFVCAALNSAVLRHQRSCAEMSSFIWKTEAIMKKKSKSNMWWLRCENKTVGSLIWHD